MRTLLRHTYVRLSLGLVALAVAAVVGTVALQHAAAVTYPSTTTCGTYTNPDGGYQPPFVGAGKVDPDCGVNVCYNNGPQYCFIGTTTPPTAIVSDRVCSNNANQVCLLDSDCGGGNTCTTTGQWAVQFVWYTDGPRSNSQVIYSAESVGDEWRCLYESNPTTPTINGNCNTATRVTGDVYNNVQSNYHVSIKSNLTANQHYYYSATGTPCTMPGCDTTGKPVTRSEIRDFTTSYFDYSVSLAPPSDAIINTGDTSDFYTVTVTPTGGMTGTVNLTVQDYAPAINGATILWEGGSGSVTISGTNPVTKRFQIRTTNNFPAGSGTAANLYSFRVRGNESTLGDRFTGNSTLTVQDYQMQGPGSTLNVFSTGSTSATINFSWLPGGIPFNEPVAISDNAGATPGLTLTYGTPSPIAAGTASMNVTIATNGVATGTRTVTITGASQPSGLQRTVTITLNVQASPDYTLSITPSTASIVQGTNATFTVTATPVSGFNEPIAVTIPQPDPTISISPSSFTLTGPAYNQALTVTTQATTPCVQTYTLTATGDDRGTAGPPDTTKQASTALTVTCLPPKDFSVSVSPTSRTVDQGASTTYTVTVTSANSFTEPVTLSAGAITAGVTTSFAPVTVTPPANGSATSTLTVDVASTATCNQTFTVTVTGDDRAQPGSPDATRSATTNLIINCFTPPDPFNLTATPVSQAVDAGATATFRATVTPLIAYNSQATIAIRNCPTGATCSIPGANPLSVFSPPQTSSTNIDVVTDFAATPPGSYVITFEATGAADGFVDTFDVTLVVNSPPDFTFNVAVSPLTLEEGQSGTFLVSSQSINGFHNPVTTTWSVTPAAPGLSFSPNAGFTITPTGSQTVTVNAANGSAGTYNLTFTGTSGSITKTAPFTIVVNPPLCGTGCAVGQTCVAVNGCQDDPAPGCNESFCYGASGNFKEPAQDGCWKSWPRCRDFDVLKVQQTRACDQWLDCQSTIAVQNPTTGKLEPQCTQLGVCVQLGANGECATFLNTAGKTNRVFTTPTDVEGLASKIRWYSGYSSGFHFADPTTIVAGYPPTDVEELGITSSSKELVPNSTFENLTCQGGARDGQSCIVDSECRVGTGLCVQHSERDDPTDPGAISAVRCESNQDCSNVSVTGSSGTVGTDACRYLASWGGDVQCKNPLASEWVGVTPPAATIDGKLDAGYGLTESDYTASALFGKKMYQNATSEAVRVRVWEDDANFDNAQSRFSGVSNPTQDPRFTQWAPEKHLKDGNNNLRVELQAGAPAFTGAGVKVADASQGLETGGEGYMLSFRFRYGVGGGVADTIKAQLALNYTPDASGRGYETTTNTAAFLDFGDIANATTSWQQYSMGPIVIPTTYNSSQTAFLNFVTKSAATANTVFYLDDVSLKPALEVAKGDTDPTSLVTIPRRCRLYPRDDSPDCNYTDTNGTHYSGWRGYCIDKDPQNESLCLTWWPLDVLRGEGGLGTQVAGYSDRFPLFYCAEEEGGTKVLDLKFSGVSQVSEQLRWEWRPANSGNNFTYSVDNGSTQSASKAGGTIHWRDIERIDVMFDPNDDVRDSENMAWLGCTGGYSNPNATKAILRSTMFSEDALDAACGGPGGGSGDDARTWATLDMSKIDRVDSDDGLRLTFSTNHFLDDRSFSQIYGASGSYGGGNNWWDGGLGWALQVHFQNLGNPNADDAIVDYIRFKAIDGGNESVMNRVTVSENVGTARVIIRLKSSCNYLVQTVKSDNGTPVEKAWASRVKPGSSYVVPDLGIAYQSDSSPFGAARGGSGEPHLWTGGWTPSGLGIQLNSGMTFREPDTGNELRLGTPYSTKSGTTGTVKAGSTAYKYCFDATKPNGQNSVRFADNNNLSLSIDPSSNSSNSCSTLADRDACNDSSTTGASACVGVPGPHCSNNPLKPCSQDSECNDGVSSGTCTAAKPDAVVGASGYDGGIAHLKRLFAASYGCWAYNADLEDTGTGTEKRIVLDWVKEGGNCSQYAWDVLSDSDGGICADTDGDGNPGPRPSSDFRIQLDINGNPIGFFPDQDSYCYVPPRITDVRVGGATSGTVDVRLGQEVTTTFSYLIDPEQLPGRLEGINWNGGSCDADVELPNATTVTATHRYLDPALVGSNIRPTFCVVDNWGAQGSVTSPVTLHILDQ